MKFIKLRSLKNRIIKRYGLNREPDWSGADSLVWKKENNVIKISLLNLQSYKDHKIMVKLGDEFPNIARIYDINPLGLSNKSGPADLWIFCLIKQKFLHNVIDNHLIPPVKWAVGNDIWQQHDPMHDNQINGLWIDTVRIRRCKCG
jgi:hypothetical protein